jgi:L-threonylcarbamoyladenylate synthase
MRVDLNQAVALLKRGGIVAIPTETVYGLAADASNEAALQQIYAIKQRPADNPLIVHIADVNQVEDWAADFPPLAKKLAKAFWPGPFTLVLPAKSQVSLALRAHQPTVALRVPAHPVALDLLCQSGLALAAPSANKFTQLSPTTAAHVTAGLGDALPVLDGGACKVGIESTIVGVEGDDWILLRPGMIDAQAVEAVVGKPARTRVVNKPKVPGQHLLHYSPRTPVYLFDSRSDLLAFVEHCPGPCAALLIGDGAYPGCQFVALKADVNDVAEKLYSSLHSLDQLGVLKLAVEMPPDTPEWLAIRDRLGRSKRN